MKGMVDVCAGKMTLGDVSQEIRHYFTVKSPSRMVVDIVRRKDGYHTVIWIPEKDFTSGRKYPDK